LFEIDPRPFLAGLDLAKAQVAVAEANLSNAQTNVARDTPLVAQNAIPRKQRPVKMSPMPASNTISAGSKSPTFRTNNQTFDLLHGQFD
jgi:membrane fusion protein (multidrug efflux system)